MVEGDKLEITLTNIQLIISTLSISTIKLKCQKQSQCLSVSEQYLYYKY